MTDFEKDMDVRSVGSDINEWCPVWDALDAVLSPSNDLFGRMRSLDAKPVCNGQDRTLPRGSEAQYQNPEAGIPDSRTRNALQSRL